MALGATLDLLRWIGCGATSVPLLGAIVLAGPLSPRAGLRIMRAWCAVQCAIFGIRVRVEGAARLDRPPYLFVHLDQTSLTESFVVPLAVPVHFRVMINLEYALLPLLGWAVLAMRNVVVVRQWPAQARRAVARAERILRRGESFFLSIEGRRSLDGSLSPYKKGATVLAVATETPIVPIVVFGARERLPHGAWRVRPGEVRVKFCAPIATAGADRAALLAELRALAERELGLAPARAAPDSQPD
jgi:1-acyl-sn-glycerol-3-phosphate acyltransferase